MPQLAVSDEQNMTPRLPFKFEGQSAQIGTVFSKPPSKTSRKTKRDVNDQRQRTGRGDSKRRRKGPANRQRRERASRRAACGPKSMPRRRNPLTARPGRETRLSRTCPLRWCSGSGLPGWASGSDSQVHRSNRLPHSSAGTFLICSCGAFLKQPPWLRVYIN